MSSPTACPNPACAEAVDPAANFCEACGSDLAVRDGTSAVTAPDAERTCRGCGTATGPDDDEYCAGCGLRHRDPTERVETVLDGLAGVSDRGLVRSTNQDAMALGRHRAGTVAAVVCDGVSTTLTPELAATTAADTALDVLLRGRADGADRTREAVLAAGRAVAKLGRAPHGPSCTLVSALVEPLPDGSGVDVAIGWIGDSRVYWLAPPESPEPARALTRDHSWATEMIAVGMDPAEAAADRRAHQITRWLGPEAQPPAPEVTGLRPAADGLLLLCTDGLWNYLDDPAELSAVALPLAAESGPLAAAAALTALAVDAGGRDNITIVIVPVSVRSRP
ncbi:PP2C family serine/threonine-protein phosphatase [Pseudonocardia humida]|uniref:Protein phosphatase 2C domain-containing protein n=1 Tax=Pseudonocardia humida TaxID=2800819 RepID=A0ABT1A3V3_9PSEU|nr:protein phosphatase 2C domain-containing protein [Pseudonocardia humida]MCO1657484.1 protein phosphatase 2C domain-containing protein [Pseudonocardia humida]